MTQDELDAKLRTVRPNGGWILRGNTYEDMEWRDETTPKPTKAELGL
jgi:hypothetical protein